MGLTPPPKGRGNRAKVDKTEAKQGRIVIILLNEIKKNGCDTLSTGKREFEQQKIGE